MFDQAQAPRREMSSWRLCLAKSDTASGRSGTLGTRCNPIPIYLRPWNDFEPSYYRQWWKQWHVVWKNDFHTWNNPPFMIELRRSMSQRLFLGLRLFHFLVQGFSALLGFDQCQFGPITHADGGNTNPDWNLQNGFGPHKSWNPKSSSKGLWFQKWAYLRFILSRAFHGLRGDFTLWEGGFTLIHATSFFHRKLGYPKNPRPYFLIRFRLDLGYQHNDSLLW